jgi:dephospho-CoA kinase
VTHVHVREVGSPGHDWSLRFRDWLRSDAGAREEYAALKLGLLAQGLTASDYTAAKEPWFDSVHARVLAHDGHSPG